MGNICRKNDSKENKDDAKGETKGELISYEAFMKDKQKTSKEIKSLIIKSLIQNILTVGWQPNFKQERYPENPIILEAVVARWKTLIPQFQGFSTKTPSAWRRMRFTVEKKYGSDTHHIVIQYARSDSTGAWYFPKHITEWWRDSIVWRDIKHHEAGLPHNPYVYIPTNTMFIRMPEDEILTTETPAVELGGKLSAFNKYNDNR